jgi:para-nitrobenzyl esterase
MRPIFSVAVSIFLTLSQTTAIPLQQPQIVTSSGPVLGTRGRFAPSVSAYLGIPFALPPTGPRRWTAPVLLESNKPTNATKFSPDCPGTLSLGNGFPPEEDCLYLNIWVPPVRRDDKLLKAVMIWIYGGAFIGGTAAMGVDGW